MRHHLASYMYVCTVEWMGTFSVDRLHCYYYFVHYYFQVTRERRRITFNSLWKEFGCLETALESHWKKVSVLLNIVSWSFFFIHVILGTSVPFVHFFPYKYHLYYQKTIFVNSFCTHIILWYDFLPFRGGKSGTHGWILFPPFSKMQSKLSC